MNKISNIIFFCFLLTSFLNAQNNYNFRQFGTESKNFYNQPLNWNSDDWQKIALISAGALLLIPIDKSVQDELQKNQEYYYSLPIEAGRVWGEMYTTGILSGATGLIGLAGNDKNFQRISFEIIQTALYSGSITVLLKALIGRARPYTKTGSMNFNPVNLFDDDFHSFPSGHSTLGFALSTILSKNFKSEFAKAIIYLPALLTTVSRVYQDKHWLSDVFMGAAIAYFVGTWVHDQHDKIESNYLGAIPNSSNIISISFSIN